MGGDRHEGEELKDHPIDDAVYLIGCGDEHDEYDDILGVEYQWPGHDAAYQAAYVLHEPQISTLWPGDAQPLPEWPAVYCNYRILIVCVVSALFHGRAYYWTVMARLGLPEMEKTQ